MQPTQTLFGRVAIPARPQWKLAWLALVTIAVAGALAGYAHAAVGGGRVLFTLGFSQVGAMKASLTTAAMLFLVVQLVTALAMWGKLPGVKDVGSGWAWAHRWSGTVAFLLTLPVAFTCVYSLGFGTADARTIVHSIVGCLFYGVFAAKMLGLRLKGLPGWTIPVLGGLLVVLLAALWFSAALWYFRQPGTPVF